MRFVWKAYVAEITEDRMKTERILRDIPLNHDERLDRLERETRRLIATVDEMLKRLPQPTTEERTYDD